MKIQQNFDNKQAFGMDINLETRLADNISKKEYKFLRKLATDVFGSNSVAGNCNDMKLISNRERKSLTNWALPLGEFGDRFEAEISPLLKNDVNDISDSRLTYSIRGTAKINGKKFKVNMVKSWLDSEGSLDDFKPIDAIKNYIGQRVQKNS